MNTKTITYLNLIAIIAAVTFNALANILPINGYNTGELSSMYPNLFVPSGFTFSIWGLIYLLCFVWVGYFILNKSAQRAYESENLGYWFIASCIANLSWILLWHHRLVLLSVVVMLIILYTLFQLYVRTRRLDHQIIKIPISVYLGWISVATIANFTTLLVDQGITGGEYADEISAIMVGIASILGVSMLFKQKDIAYAGVIVWALYGIYTNHDYTFIHIATLTGIVVLLTSMVYVLTKTKRLT